MFAVSISKNISYNIRYRRLLKQQEVCKNTIAFYLFLEMGSLKVVISHKLHNEYNL